MYNVLSFVFGCLHVQCVEFRVLVHKFPHFHVCFGAFLETDKASQWSITQITPQENMCSLDSYQKRCTYHK